MKPITLYPFSALVGQETMQLALILNAINPAIGGVLIRGQKGTAKSTAARALAHLLPRLTNTAVPIRMNGTTTTEALTLHRQLTTAPFIELPLGASDDRLVGSLDIEQALQTGERHFEPGLLAQVHGGILYVDEVNLLPDHLVDVLLDAAASGVNTVEREGVSVTHPAKFMLIGTMNPEEGDLRPQLLDRFGLAVEVGGSLDPKLRAEVVRRRIAYEANPAQFTEQYAPAEIDLRQRIALARQQCPTVQVGEAMLELITHICAGSGVDGLRADITMYKTAQTLAAWHNRPQVTVTDVRQAAELVLLHRRRRQPFEEPGVDQAELEQLIEEHQQQSNQHPRESQTESTQEDE